MSVDEVLGCFESDLRMFIGERAPRHVFVHAGAVGWRGHAIVIPGRTFTGKTRLVAALCARGATYYSDEFAVLDARGRLHPFPTDLSIREPGDTKGTRRSAASIGAVIGGRPLPVTHVVATRYRPDARWRPHRVPAGRALLGLLAHTVCARFQPHAAMRTVGALATSATVWRSDRGDAEETADALLEHLAAHTG